MAAAYPEFKAPMLGLAILAVPFLWFFDWAGWAWALVIFLYVAAIGGWLSEALKVYRANQATTSESSSRGRLFEEPSGTVSDLEGSPDADDFLNDGKTVWQGSRQIRFAYRDHKGSFTDREVTVHRVVSMGRSNEDTYFRGLCHMRGEPRTFRLDRIKGNKVADTATGEFATFRQLFGLRR